MKTEQLGLPGRGPSDNHLRRQSYVSWMRLAMAGTALCLVLSGCETLGLSEPDAEPQRVAAAQTGGADPNLGDVPSQAPATSSAASRQTAREGLLADRAQARYSDETLTGEGLVGTAPGLTDPTASASSAPAAPPFSSLDQGTATQSATAQTQSAPTQARAQPRQAYQLGGSRAAGAAQSAQQSRSAVQPGAGQSSAPQAPAVATGNQQAALPPTPQLPTPQLPPTQPALPAGPPVLLGVIYFNHGSTSLSNQDLNVLRQVVALQRERGGILRVVGHASQRTGQADPRAHQAINSRLSQRRADSVARALRGFGMRPEAIVAEGRGDAELLYYEFMPSGEAGNRRVEIFLQS